MQIYTQEPRTAVPKVHMTDMIEMGWQAQYPQMLYVQCSKVFEGFIAH